MEEAAAVVAPMVTIPVAAPVIKGQSIRRTWKARVVNMQAIIDAAATGSKNDNRLAKTVLIVNQTALDAFARSTKGAVTIPGVEMYEEQTMASGSR